MEVNAFIQLCAQSAKLRCTVCICFHLSIPASLGRKDCPVLEQSFSVSDLGLEMFVILFSPTEDNEGNIIFMLKYTFLSPQLLEDDPWPRLNASESVPSLMHSSMISEKYAELPNEIAKSNLPSSGAALKDSGPQDEKCSKALALRIQESYSNGLSVSLSPSNSTNSGTDQKSLKVSPNSQTKAQDAERTPTANFKRTLEESNSGPAVKKPRRGLSRNMGVQAEGISTTPQRKNSNKLAMRRSLRGQKKLSSSLFHPPRKAVCVC